MLVQRAGVLLFTGVGVAYTLLCLVVMWTPSYYDPVLVQLMLLGGWFVLFVETNVRMHRGVSILEQKDAATREAV